MLFLPEQQLQWKGQRRNNARASEGTMQGPAKEQWKGQRRNNGRAKAWKTQGTARANVGAIQRAAKCMANAKGKVGASSK